MAETPIVSIEQKILTASSETAQIMSVFNPGIAAAIAAGVAVEPLLKGMVQMFLAIFHHKMGVAPPASTGGK